jgi:histidine ammonia-lyase
VSAARAKGTDLLYRHIRADVPTYADDRPLGWDLEKARDLLRKIAASTHLKLPKGY